jgi:hypothetical protein
MKIKYKIKEVKPKIFLAEFEDSYDMCMTFCRYQEYYESPNPKFRNKDFDIFTFMKWYSGFHGKGNFTYPTDWVGFNIPSKILNKCISSIGSDWNCYDETMNDIVSKIENKIYNNPNHSLAVHQAFKEEKYYLIGAMKGSERTVRHEVAHGMYYLNSSYRKEMDYLVNKLSSKFKKDLFVALKSVGYTDQVLIDEAQAFLSTGWRDYFPKLKNQDKPFISVFERYYNEP